MSKTITDLTTALSVQLQAHHRAKTQYDPEENPFAGQDLGKMMVGLEFPAINMAPKSDVGRCMEEARIEGMATAKTDTGQRRSAEARARAQRKVEFDAIADADVRPNRERMDDAWAVVAPMYPIILKMAKEKEVWASRYLGSTADDVPQMAIEKMALMLAKSDRDLDLLAVAANELSDVTRRTGSLPSEQGELSKDERKERKRLKAARKWLMSVANNRMMSALVDAYTNQRNLRWDNLDIVATVMASITMPGPDPLFNAHKAGRAPAFLGTRFQAPDGIDSGLLAAGINGALTDRGLDPLVEFLLDEEHRRTDGAVKWSEFAEDIFKLTPDGSGEWIWDTVVAATTGVRRDGTVWPTDRARKARGDAARAHVRNLFGFMPSVIVGLVEAFDQQRIAYSVTSGRAVMASDFEAYLPEPEAGPRKFLQPALKFADSTAAAQALLEHLSDLITGEDLVASAVNA